jgi:23S rRNA pseudouridine1911/1915/1917 synthase
MLHAWRLGFVHPKTGEQIQCTQAMPKAMWRLVLILGRRLQRVGLTGMPGAGKTSFLQTLSDQGLPVWSADQEVRALYAPGADGTIMLRRRFGDEVLDERGAVDKVVLIGLMQGSSAVSREVQQLIHPLVSHRLEQFWAESSQARVAVAEVPLLFESESFEGRRFEVIIGLFCPRSLRSSRLKAFRGWDSETLDYLESGQWTAGAKLRGCQLIVVNDGDLETLGRRAKVVETILRRLRRKVLRDLYQGLQGYLLSRVKKGD